MTLEALKQRAKRLKAETLALSLAMRHPETPWYAKGCVAAVVAYAFSPIDLIPDFIPVLGYLDELILLPLGIAFALRLIPPHVLTECRQEAQSRLAQGKPISWAGGAFILILWVGAVALCLWGLLRRFNPS